MNISQEGLDLIKQFEGFSASPYPDVAKIATIGYGTTKYPSGQPVRLSDAKCTKEQAETWLQNALESFISDLNRLIKVQVAQSQFDALCSLIYNIGTSNFSTSTLLKKLNKQDPSVADEFLRWNIAGGKIVEGLTNRRKQERALFLKK